MIIPTGILLIEITLFHVGTCVTPNEEVFMFNSDPGGGSSSQAPINVINEADFELPPGYKVIDGVLMDTTNIMSQIKTPNSTEYRLYQAGRDVEGIELAEQVMFRRPRQEAGWHYIMFEDPNELPGSGHMILLQKVLGFTLTRDVNNRDSDIRLYEAFHIDFSDSFGGSLEEDHRPKLDIGNQNPDESNMLDPNDFLFGNTEMPSASAGLQYAKTLSQQGNPAFYNNGRGLVQGGILNNDAESGKFTFGNLQGRVPGLPGTGGGYIPRGHVNVLDVAHLSKNSLTTAEPVVEALDDVIINKNTSSAKQEELSEIISSLLSSLIPGLNGSISVEFNNSENTGELFQNAAESVFSDNSAPETTITTTEETLAYPIETTQMPEVTTDPEVNQLNDDVNGMAVTTFYFEDNYSVPPGPNFLSTLDPNEMETGTEPSAILGYSKPFYVNPNKPVPRMKRDV